MFKKVAIVGTGLIGGSLALAIKKKGLAQEVVGVSRHQQSLNLAKRMGAIDRGSRDLGIIRGSELLILATPIEVMLSLAPKIAKFVSDDCLVTDTGSTKNVLVNKLEELFVNFVGSHPLAGSEKTGIANAGADLLRHSLCILTPTKRTPQQALRKITLFWQKLGARIVLVEPRLHDKILSFTSHLPHMVAFSLLNAIPPNFLKFSAGGLKDMTRIASSDAQLWADIFLSNRRNVLRAISLFQANLLQIKQAIQDGDRESLLRLLRQASSKRGRLER